MSGHDPLHSATPLHEAKRDQERVRRRGSNGHDPRGHEAWPDPMDLLGQTVEAAAPLPIEVLPAAFQDFVADVADRMQCPPDFVTVPLLVEAATLIGRGFRLAPKANDDWSERACLWGAGIGGSAAHKTPDLAAPPAPTAPPQLQR